MADGMAALDKYSSSDSSATDDDCETSVAQSQETDFDLHKKVGVEGSDDDSSYSSRSLVEARMAGRNAKIRKRKLKRRGLDDSDEEESEEMFVRTPY
jgi:hypothetical protein